MEGACLLDKKVEAYLLGEVEYRLEVGGCLLEGACSKEQSSNQAGEVCLVLGGGVVL